MLKISYDADSFLRMGNFDRYIFDLASLCPRSGSMAGDAKWIAEFRRIV